MLYWYRTPPGVRLGRQPFDPDVQKLIEQQNPGVTFDWDTIVNTPMPPPDMTEYWRERRRQEKAAKQERRAAEAAEVADPEEQAVEASADPGEPESSTGPEGAEDSGAAESQPVIEASAESGTESTDAGVPADGANGPARKRRRRRGGRRRRTEATDQAGQPLAAEPDGGDDSDGSDPSDGDDPASEGE